MKLLIAQPKRETGLEQFEREIAAYPEVDLIVYPEGYCTVTELERVQHLAKQFETAIVLGYKDEANLDRAAIIDATGTILLNRAKTPEAGPLYTPSTANDGSFRYGYVLCREIFLGNDGLREESGLDLIFNPIGVGMFSEEQYVEWSGEARIISQAQQALMIGTSHADGSYRNCGFSIPLAFIYDETGEPLLLSHNDTRTRLFDTVTRHVEVVGTPSLS